MSIFRFASAALIGAAVLTPPTSQAQTYPSKPIHFILPYIPGGIIDTAGRHLALRLSESLGQSVVPENRPGAGGMVGADVVARSAPAFNYPHSPRLSADAILRILESDESFVIPS